MIDKIKNPKSIDESRMIFDYSKITKLFLKAHMKLSFKIHNHLFNSRHECLFLADLKYTYLTISLHSNDKHYFIFTISKINQV